MFRLRFNLCVHSLRLTNLEADMAQLKSNMAQLEVRVVSLEAKYGGNQAKGQHPRLKHGGFMPLASGS